MKGYDKFNLLPPQDLADKLERMRTLMAAQGVDTLFVADNNNKYYLTGRIFSGYILIGLDSILWFVRRPSVFREDRMILIRKVENIVEHIDTTKLGRIAFELNQMSYADITRFAKALNVSEFSNADGILNIARAIKTPYELSLIERSGECLSRVYSRIPSMYRPGMTDIDLQIEIERISRMEGCLGILRVNGSEMELNMGCVLVGDNADNPSPYDFAMGGAGFHPSLPVGADGTVIRQGHSVMVDTNGDFTGYMTDMTRTFTCGKITDDAVKAHHLSIDICNRLAVMGQPGVKASDLYSEALNMAINAGLGDRFMGHRSQAGFVGHGVGIAINEGPVISPRSRDILQRQNVIALEPKFVIEGVGAVGVENTYIVEDGGMRCTTFAPEHLIDLLD